MPNHQLRAQPNHNNTITKSLSYAGILLSLFCFILGPLSSHAETTQHPPTSIIAASGKININHADAHLLAKTLKGVGLKKAEAIIHYRNTYGPFAHIEELVEVKGIGHSILEKNAHLIVVE